MKINEVTLNENDSIIFTVGDLNSSIFPTKKDLNSWKKLLNNVQRGNYTMVAPPILEITIVHLNGKSKGESK